MPLPTDIHHSFHAGAAQSAIEELRAAAASCTACPLYRNATQTVFGEGPPDARVMLVGEQPGDAEDLAGHPFVGPAGKLLDHCLSEAGIDRTRVWVTNIVKHFKWVARGKRRIHSKPGSVEIAACLPWLEAEVQAVAPSVLVAMGATAAQTLFGQGVPRGQGSRQVCAIAFCPSRACDRAFVGAAAGAGRRHPASRDEALHR